MTAIRELADLRVTLDKLERSPMGHLPGTPEGSFAFTYHITIHNDTAETVTIKARKWVLQDGEGRISAYEGDGVVGAFPKLEPGERFHYHSYHLVTASSSAEGAYLGVNEQGEPVLARIPRFQMDVPDAV
ncbi:MAG: ApaG domain [Verrucomicrobium sp.]|nr:ApaG domain [Verrucomicrobium sp.]